MGLWTWELGDVGTRGRVGCEDVVTQTRAGTQGRDKQATPDFCSEFLAVKCKII